ncbi:MAG: porin [Sphingobacteriales bacterium]|nr:porin [Sphingobacteriales bacterium]
MDMVDTSKDMGKSMLSIYKKYDRLKISGYIQPQYQAVQMKGAKGYAGGDFMDSVDNRFMLRRGRMKIEYLHIAEGNGPSVQFVYQFDGSEKGFQTRDFWGRVMENKYQLFSLTAGIFARPFSYELNLGSGDRESPERGRMSQILTKIERDLGAMVSFEPRKKNHPLKHLRIDAGFFNGPGLNATADYDSYKDFITRIYFKPYPISKTVTFSAAASYFNGGFIQNTPYAFRTVSVGGIKTFSVDSSLANKGRKLPRIYYGVDAQVKIKNSKGCYTELRAEFAMGTQTATLTTSETPFALLTGNAGYYKRQFNGAYFYLLQHITPQHQLAAKFDWYDPNTDVKGSDIGKAGSNLNATDIKYTTLGLGYIYYINENLKLVLWYDRVFNENTKLAGYTSDVKDDVFTSRLQFRF